MQVTRMHIYFLLAGFAIGGLCGFFTGKAMYQPRYEEKVSRDTVIVHDTVPDINPTPKDSATIRYITRFLPVVKNDTINHFVEVSKMIQDTVEVQVPITSKHFSGKNYDAYVSGFEPNLDSIKVYTETKVVTNTITKVKSPNKWELDIVGGIDYNTAQDKYTPYAVGELLYKPSRLQVGIHGGIIKADKVEPVVGAKIKYRIL